MAAEDNEITLGAGKMLGLFFMLAAICGIFFAVGYSLGKTSAREQGLSDRTAEERPANGAGQASTGTGSAATARNSEIAPTANSDEAEAKGPDLTFYKAVKQSGQDANADLQTPQPAEAPHPNSGPSQANPASALKSGGDTSSRLEPTAGSVPANSEAISPLSAQAATPPAGRGTYLVQIAAVSHEEDAAALAGALRKKSFAAAVVNNPAGKDRLFHVVLGPYATLQDAEAMKLKLQSEGYNPIVKR
jgi:DedD protein